MKGKFALLVIFVIVFASSFLGFMWLWSKAMACADFGHGCRLTVVDDRFLTFVSLPVSALPDGLLLHVFGPDTVLPMLLLNATLWSIAVLKAIMLVDRLRKKL
jgi:hypothetical protein